MTLSNGTEAIFSGHNEDTVAYPANEITDDYEPEVDAADQIVHNDNDDGYESKQDSLDNVTATLENLMLEDPLAWERVIEELAEKEDRDADEENK